MTSEQQKLMALAGALEQFAAHSGGELPRDLAPLRDYADWPRVLRPEADPLGPFPDRYAFLPAKPWVEAPGAAPKQLLAISVKPGADGSRGAVWRYRAGEYAGGTLGPLELEAGLKNFSLADVKPMGGGVPTPTHPFPEPPITDYQAKVMQLVREDKITPPPRSESSAARQVNSALPTPAASVAPTIAPRSTPTNAARRELPAGAAQRERGAWPWAIAGFIVVGIALFAWKRRG
ncbi:hypothetical protein CfE428DRAFT_5576 [Chthoniobacter flavus Ellin428]|uniref:Uncharacterized protein n=1 Tax=Chthoniobacter flavus Ellin428 TaxID=497964 RepID=B4D9I6_9BACT|nr:hypothetical protein [Chthoniobacter flavus]EDY16947.1 hypothetical protein CfE428DRAFT_5576 [Chthoniobacter flavus Ellin428]TCO87824.1 hypothetical protein EV701_120123 [Chthoniobacter flavus]